MPPSQCIDGRDGGGEHRLPYSDSDHWSTIAYYNQQQLSRILGSTYYLIPLNGD